MGDRRHRVLRARLARIVADAGYQLAEAPTIGARTRRGVGKSDELDAGRITAAVLAIDVDELRRPRRDDGVPACGSWSARAST